MRVDPFHAVSVARHGVVRVNSHVHLHVPAACALYDAPEDGCTLHPKHVEQGKCNKVTLNNLHQAGLNKRIPRYFTASVCGAIFC